MAGHFEVRQYDGAGRVGDLDVPRADATVRTPALLPVVNPHVQTVPPRALAETFGCEALITNAYILHGSEDLREPALEQGVHDLLDFPGVVMTDSGSFQLAEYGNIDVTTEEILAFQDAIGADIGTPVDVPTPPDADRERAAEELATTQERIETATDVDVGDMLVTAPVQGSTFPDLREQAGEHAAATGLDVFPVGAVVPLLNDYRFADVVDAVRGAKRGLGEAAPVHLFGAGHPMMFALAAALGCDLFDSAAYALYARDGRYLTVRGTEPADELSTLPCSCPVCTDHEPADFVGDDEAHARRLAKHNLHVSVAEVRRVRQAIRDGSLFSLLDARARAHPAMLDAYRTLLDYREELAATDPTVKGTFFHTSTESARRPEVERHRERIARFEPSGHVLVTPDGVDGDGDWPTPDEHWRIRPPFGPFPPAVADAYPLTAHRPERLSPQAYAAAAEGVETLTTQPAVERVTLATRGWPDAVLADVPDAVVNVEL